MDCFIYKSSKKDDLYLYITKKDDFSSIPDSLSALLGNPVYVMALTLTPERKLARADIAVVLEQLLAQGYYVQMPPPPGFEPLP